MGMLKTIPASVKLFLFADKLVPADNVFSASTMIPYNQKKVKTNELAVFLLAFTLWDLFQKNCISLQLINAKKLFILPYVKLIIGINKEIPFLGDLENWLIGGISGTDEEVKTLIYRLLHENQVWPHKKIINMVVFNACYENLGRIDQLTSDASKLLKGFTGNTNFEVNVSTVALLEPEFELLLQQWNQFCLSSSTVSEALISACRSALNSRITQTE